MPVTLSKEARIALTVLVLASAACQTTENLGDQGHASSSGSEPSRTPTLSSTATPEGVVIPTSISTATPTSAPVFARDVVTAAELQAASTDKTTANLNASLKWVHDQAESTAVEIKEYPLFQLLTNYRIGEVKEGVGNQVSLTTKEYAYIASGLDEVFQDKVKWFMNLEGKADDSATGNDLRAAAETYAQVQLSKLGSMEYERIDGVLHIKTAVIRQSIVADNTSSDPMKNQTSLCVRYVPEDQYEEGFARSISGDPDSRVRALVSMGDDVLVVNVLVTTEQEAFDLMPDAFKKAGFRPAVNKTSINGVIVYDALILVNRTAGVHAPDGKYYNLNDYWDRITGINKTPHLVDEKDGVNPDSLFSICGQVAELVPSASVTITSTLGAPQDTPGFGKTPTVTVRITPTPPGATQTLIATNPPANTVPAPRSTPTPEVTPGSTEEPKGTPLPFPTKIPTAIPANLASTTEQFLKAGEYTLVASAVFAGLGEGHQATIIFDEEMTAADDIKLRGDEKKARRRKKRLQRKRRLR